MLRLSAAFVAAAGVMALLTPVGYAEQAVSDEGQGAMQRRQVQLIGTTGELRRDGDRIMTADGRLLTRDDPADDVELVFGTPTAAVRRAHGSELTTVTLRMSQPGGEPCHRTLLHLMNVDDRTKYDDVLGLGGGTGEAAVPPGHYVGLGFCLTEDRSRHWITIEEFTVADKAVEVTFDTTKAIAERTYATPRPAKHASSLNVTSLVDATGERYGWVMFDSMDPGARLFIQPHQALTRGSFEIITNALLEHRDAKEPYSYLLPVVQNATPANQRVTFTGKDLATIHRSITDPQRQPVVPIRMVRFKGWDGLIAAGQYTNFDNAFLTTQETSTEYVAGQSDTILGYANDLVYRSYTVFAHGLGNVHGGKTYRDDNTRAPAVSRIFLNNNEPHGTCAACRSGDTVSLMVDAVRAANPLEHYELRDAKTDTNYRAYQLELSSDGEILGQTKADSRTDPTSNRPLLVADVPPADAPYTLQFAHKWVTPGRVLNTDHHVKWTFRSQHTTGNGLPPNYKCPAGDECRPLQLLTVRNLDLPTGLDAAMPPGPAQMQLQFGHNDLAKDAPITDAAMELSYDDGKTWTKTKITRKDAHRFAATWTNPKMPTGSVVSMRLSAADTAGNTFTETITGAYLIR